MKRATAPTAASEPDHASGGPYRIRVVAELTLVPEPTLRAWERRYGIPTPERTAAGYRLYGAAEVEQVRVMKALCDGGVSAREAAAQVRARTARTARIAGIGVKRKGSAQGDPWAGARAALLDAVSRFDVDDLDRTLQRLAFAGDATTLLDRVLAPVLVEIGERWHAGEASVAEEHLASQRIGSFVRDLVRLAPGSSSGRRVVLATFADDEHEIGLLGLALRLATWELRPVFLGARTPPAAVRTAVESASPVLVALSLTVPLDLPRARELVSGYAEACGRVPWVVGGAGAPSLASLVTEAGGLLDPGDPLALRAMVEHATRERARERRS